MEVSEHTKEHAWTLTKAKWAAGIEGRKISSNYRVKIWTDKVFTTLSVEKNMQSIIVLNKNTI